MYKKMKIYYFPKVAIQTSRNNSYNHFDYTPFYIDNYIWTLDKDYYVKLPDNIRHLIHTHFPKLAIKTIEYPHPIQVYDTDAVFATQPLDEHRISEFWLLYKLFIHSFREEFWLPSNTNMWINPKIVVKIPKNEVVLLKIALETDDSVYSIRDNLEFLNDINPILDRKTQYFVKLSCGSSKNDEEIKPISTVYDLLRILCVGSRFIKEYISNGIYEWFDTYIILTKWIDIEDKDEYRVIMKNKHLRGICHSKWWEFHPKSTQEKEDVVKACENLIDDIVGYQDGVLDVYYDKINKKAWLIEINSYGPGLSSGSGLFHWIRDYKNLCGEPFNESVWLCLT